MPQEYVDAGFGGTIDFRGYKYVRAPRAKIF